MSNIHRKEEENSYKTELVSLGNGIVVVLETVSTIATATEYPLLQPFVQLFAIVRAQAALRGHDVHGHGHADGRRHHHVVLEDDACDQTQAQVGYVPDRGDVGLGQRVGLEADASPVFECMPVGTFETLGWKRRRK